MATSLTGIFNKRGLDISMTKEELYVYNFATITLNFCLSYEPRSEKNRSSGFPTRSDANRAVQTQKVARSLKFRV